MSRYKFSKIALSDLDDIWKYTVSQRGLDQAEIYLRDIQAAVQTFADDPRKERRCDEVRRGYSKYLIGFHVLLFRAAADGIQIVRKLHQRMDFGRYL